MPIYNTVENILCGYFCPKKSKLKWLGALEDLKPFVLTEIDKVTAESITWPSPNGGTCKLESELLAVIRACMAIKNYEYIIRRRKGEGLTERVISYLKQSRNKSLIDDNLAVVEPKNA